MLLIIRSVLATSYFFIIALLGTLACLFRPFNPDNTRLCGRMFGWGGLKLLGVKLIIENPEAFEMPQAGVVIANHQSNLDLFVHGSVIPKRTVSVGKKSLKYLPLFGQVYWLAGNIMIDRKKSKESINTMTETTDAIRNHNTSIWVFAEGTRNGGNNLLPFKKGAFHMADKAKAPILPICASSYPKHINLNKWHAGTIRVRALPQVLINEDSDLSVTMIDTQAHMQSTIQELDQKITG